jgi:hypothetical protein
MRSPAEIRFRLGQEAVNAWRFCFPPQLPPFNRPEPQLFAPPGGVVDSLGNTEYAERLIGLAEQILKRRFPLLGYTVDLDQKVHWRRDPVHNIETSRKYFRLLPYLDASRVGDHKIIWELNRQQHLVVLAQAWRLTGRREFLDDLAALLESWFDQNPYGRGMNWVSALEVAFRALSWIWIDHLAGSDLPASTAANLRRGLYQHACYLERNLSIYFSPNTHLLGEALALYALGRYFSALPEGQRWTALGRQHMERQLEVQVRADGSHFEQSTYYHVYALDMFLCYAILSGGAEGSIAPGLAGKIRLMADYLWALLGPTGEIPYLGDDDGGRLFHPWGNARAFGRASLALAAVLLKELRWPCSAEDLHPMALWWRGPSVLTSAQPAWRSWQGAHLFPDAGVAVVARGQEHSVVDTRAFGWARAGHGHAHALAIVHRVKEREFLIDPGTYTYVGEPALRDQFRGTAAHNTVRVDGLDQATPAGPFAWRDHPQTRVDEWDPKKLYLRATCRYREITHTRTFQWESGRIRIVDQLDGPPGEHRVEQVWHLVRQEDRSLFQFSCAQEHLRKGTALSVNWTSPVFGSKQPSATLQREIAGSFPMTLETVLDTTLDEHPSDQPDGRGGEHHPHRLQASKGNRRKTGQR